MLPTLLGALVLLKPVLTKKMVFVSGKFFWSRPVNEATGDIFHLLLAPPICCSGIGVHIFGTGRKN
jgi:hypothetical protein